MAIERDDIVQQLEECIFNVNEGCNNVDSVREALLGIVDELYCEEWSDECDEEGEGE